MYMKKSKEQDLIERYLYDVIRRLPESQREDIKQELSSLIDDMLSERTKGGDVKEEDVKTVLLELGKPSELAMKYKGGQKVLIGESFYEPYFLTLKIVLACTGFGMLIAAFVSTMVVIFEPSELTKGITEGLELFVEIPGVLLSAFAWVTIIFAIIERIQGKRDLKGVTIPFDLDQLPKVPEKKARIPRSESVVGIIFTLIFGILACFAPQILGVWYIQDESTVVVPLLNLSIWDEIVAFIALSVLLSLLDEIVKLIVGRYQIWVAITTITTEILNLGIFAFLLTRFQIWNPDFVTQLEIAMNQKVTSSGDLLLYWNSAYVNRLIIFVVAVICLITCIKTIYHTVRYYAD